MHGFPTSSSHRSSWRSYAAAAWFLLSAYPVYLYYFSSQHATPSTLHNDALHALESAIPQTISSEPVLPTDAFRTSDFTDAFESFNRSDNCAWSSLELHQPFSPLCTDKDSLLQAMTYGGRHGTDAPFSPRGCDMRWFSSSELCDILSRFSRINIMGDSLMRDLTISMHVFLRASLTSGGRTDWTPDPEGKDCTCNGVYDDKDCAWHSVVSSEYVYAEAPQTMVCPNGKVANVEFHTLTSYPLDDGAVSGLANSQPSVKPSKPVAHVMGHGLWNDMQFDLTQSWLAEVENITSTAAPWLYAPGQYVPRLFLTPNAAHDEKIDMFIAHQGNIAVSRFEKAVGAYVRGKGIDHLGTYNMSIQASSYDGTHAGMRTNLIKAMMVFNWLAAVDVEKW